MLVIFSRSDKTNFSNFQWVSPRTSFMYQVFTTISQILLSRLDKSKRVKLPTKGVHCKTSLPTSPSCPFRSSHLKYFLSHPFWQTSWTWKFWQVSFYHQSHVGCFYIVCIISKRQNYIMWVATPWRLYSINFIKNKLTVWDNFIYFFQLATPSG